VGPARHVHGDPRGSSSTVEAATFARLHRISSADFGLCSISRLNHFAIIVRGERPWDSKSASTSGFRRQDVARVATISRARHTLVQVRRRLFLGAGSRNISRCEDAVARLRMIGDGALRAPRRTRRRLSSGITSETLRGNRRPARAMESTAEVSRREFWDDTHSAMGVLDRPFVRGAVAANRWLVRYMGSGIATFDNGQKATGRLRPRENRSRLYRMGRGHYESALASRRRRLRSRRRPSFSTHQPAAERACAIAALLPFVSLKGKTAGGGLQRPKPGLALPL